MLVLQLYVFRLTPHMANMSYILFRRLRRRSNLLIIDGVVTNIKLKMKLLFALTFDK